MSNQIEKPNPYKNPYSNSKVMYNHVCVNCIQDKVAGTLAEARDVHHKFHSIHEAYGVIAEEFTQLQSLVFCDVSYIRKNTADYRTEIREKALKLSAMAQALVLECL